jgi:hypothetical protein
LICVSTCKCFLLPSILVDFSGCTGFSNEVLIKLLESDPSPGVIRNIDFSDTNIELGCIGLSKNRHIGNNCKVIKMRNLPRVLDSMMQWIAAGCNDLQFIDLSGCQLSDYCVGYLLNCRK